MSATTTRHRDRRARLAQTQRAFGYAARRYRFPGHPDKACLANTAGEARAWLKRELGVDRLPAGTPVIAEVV